MENFMEIALEYAENALQDGDFPVGCIIVYKDEIIADGIRINSKGIDTNELDHAEIRALRKLTNLDEPINRKECTLYTTLEPCLMCFAAIIINGIGKIVYAYEDAMGGYSGCDISNLKPIYKNSGIVVVSNVLRERSLVLFKKFFSNPRNLYLKNTLLSSYTLNLI
ncbi:MAG: nucleoside deaminase [Desulfobacterales bacterium]|nr:nucleoside deaminase [Desulfobacterales bacterium]